MRIEKLADNKIKVTLTTADLTRLNIDINNLTPSSRELHTFLFHIMETVREETGFNPYNGQIVVEATPMREGIIVLISKLKRVKANFTRDQLKRARVVRARVKDTDVEADAYGFASFDDLCRAFALIEDDAFVHSMLYKIDGVYCCLMNRKSGSRSSRHILSEFASEVASPMKAEHIKEHGELIESGSKLARMAAGIKKLNG